MDNAVNPVAAQVVDNAQAPNTNGVPGSLPGETKAETVARMYKVKVDGQEREVSEDDLIKNYSLGQGAQKRMEEAAMSKKEAAEIMRLFKNNPKAAMQHLGIDARKFAEQTINDEMREAMMDPKDREIRDWKTKAETFENERRQAQETYEKEQAEAEINRHAQSIQGEIINVLETAGLPKTERTIGRIVYYMQSALQAGYNVMPKDVIDQVKADYRHDINSMLGGLPEEVLETFLGQDMVRKIAKTTVKAEKKPTVVPKSVNENRGEKKEVKKVMSPKDFFKNL